MDPKGTEPEEGRRAGEVALVSREHEHDYGVTGATIYCTDRKCGAEWDLPTLMAAHLARATPQTPAETVAFAELKKRLSAFSGSDGSDRWNAEEWAAWDFLKAWLAGLSPAPRTLDGATLVDARSAAVTTRGAPGESYEDFTKRVAADNKRVAEKVAALDRFVPYCRACGQTCNPAEAGTHCKENGMQMASRWARELAPDVFYSIGHFTRGGWSMTVDALAPWLDRVRAGAEDGGRP